MICPNCGNPITGASRYCPVCGSDTGIRESESNTDNLKQPNVNGYSYYDNLQYQKEHAEEIAQQQQLQQQQYLQQQQAIQQQEYQQQMQYQQPTNGNPVYGQPQYGQPQYQQSYYQQPVQPQSYAKPANYVPPNKPYTPPDLPYRANLGMAWYKFIIYFQLWITCILMIRDSVVLLSGSQYEGYKVAIYNVVKGLKTLDLICGIAYICLVLFTVWVWYELFKYKKNGPKMYIGLCIVGNLLSIIYVVTFIMLFKSNIRGVTASMFNLTFYYIEIAIHTVMIIINIIYFRNRKHLFVN